MHDVHKVKSASSNAKFEVLRHKGTRRLIDRDQAAAGFISCLMAATSWL
jgi:hypothetical protein